ncbi:MAG: hypothetical protein ACE5GM_11275 [bacterium]
MAIKPLDSKQLWLGLLFGLLYGLLLILTTHSYGVAPDTPLGYFKGERIFQYLLSGNKKIVDSWGKKDDYTPYESVNHPRVAKAIPDFTPGKISTWGDDEYAGFLVRFGGGRRSGRFFFRPVPGLVSPFVYPYSIEY